MTFVGAGIYRSHEQFKATHPLPSCIGFEIPKAVISEPGLIALRALQNQESVVAA
jgi:hypothetical protein